MTRKRKYEEYNPFHVIGSIGAAHFYSKYVHPWKEAKDPPWGKYKPYPKIKMSKANEATKAGEDVPVGVHTKTIHVNTGNHRLRGLLKHHITYRDSFYQLMTCNAGFEIFMTPSYVGTTSQFLTGTSSATAANRDSVSFVEFFGLNPLQGIPAGNHINVQNNPVSDKIGITHSEQYFDIKNVTSQVCYFQAHVFVSETDQNNPPLYMYNAGVTADSLYSTSFAFGANAATLPATSGNEISNYTAASTGGPENLLALPYTNLMSKRILRSTWRKLKTYKHCFSGGDQLRLVVNAVNNQFGLKERLNNLSVVFPKGCIAVVFQNHGGLVLDSVNSRYVYGATKLAMTVSRRIHLAPMRAPNARFETTYVGAQQYQAQTIANTTDVTLNTVAVVPGVTE